MTDRRSGVAAICTGDIASVVHAGSNEWAVCSGCNGGPAHVAIRADRRPDDKVLAREREVHPRTVRRDLEFMRDQLRAPITFDPVRRADRDYLAGDVILDLGPAVGDALKEQLGIEDDDSPQLPSSPLKPDFRRSSPASARSVAALWPGVAMPWWPDTTDARA